MVAQLVAERMGQGVKARDAGGAQTVPDQGRWDEGLLLNIIRDVARLTFNPLVVDSSPIRGVTAGPQPSPWHQLEC